MEVRTVLVEPKTEENIGAVARVLKNFGFHELYMVKPPCIGTKAMAVASHARDLLKSARIVDTVEEAVEKTTIVAGTTARRGISGRKHLRLHALTPYELKTKVKDRNGVLALLFGREDTGLQNEELKRCDLVVTIPAVEEYPVMNLSHAVAIIIYELRDVESSRRDTVKLASVEDKERLFTHIQAFLDEIGYKPHKKEETMLMLRRVFGRAELTAGEVRTMRGILRKAEWKLSDLKTILLQKSAKV